MSPNRPSLSVRTVVQLGLLALLFAISLNYETILDDYALATFHPAPDMGAIEGRLGLTQRARAYFYRSQPQIDDKASFNRDCNTQPHELELGCYFRGRIYILRIDNQSLSSEVDAVTAHELLHAEWTRMSTAERNKVGAELEQAYAGLNNIELQQRMAGYAQSEPGEQDNELHSILGTEFANLSPELETHYQKFFSNRAVIVAAHSTYLGVFSSRREQLAADLAKIRSEKGQLGALNAQMDYLKQAGAIDNYNALVPKQNRLVDEINGRIAQYQAAVDEYNALSKSLDSQTITDTEAPAQTQ